MIDGGKRNLLGIMIDVVDYEGALAKVIHAAKEGLPLGVSALAVHGVMTGVQDRTHQYRLNRLDLVVPDGQPVRWALNILHSERMADRVYGPQLTLEVCRRAASESLPIYLYGSRRHVLDRLCENLAGKFPGLAIAGAQASRFRRLDPDEKRSVIEEIRSSGARIVLVGLGCPRQEVWVYEYCEALGLPVLAVGAAFDFHAGNLPQAPALLQRSGLEWAFRLCMEPRRLWKRYLYNNPYYVWLVFCQWAGLKRFDSSAAVMPREELGYG
jgi:exopolysaccharide biosynthesis WecB/TagA/CpsF family protein